MKVTKQVEIPAEVRTQLDHIKCDLCDATTTRHDNWSGTSSYDINEVTVALKSGTGFPDGGGTESIVIDICPNCFKEKLVPWFIALGGSPRKEEHDW